MTVHVGLDAGIASVGWCVIDPEAEKILGIGVRTFAKAEDPKTGASLALPRRMARSARRRLRRRAHRMSQLRDLVIRSGMLTETEYADAFRIICSDATPYELRVDGLDRLLTEREWARVLSVMCKRRGYRSMRLGEDTDSDEGVVKESIAENQRIMTEKGYRTVGEMLVRDERFSGRIRNKGDYRGVVSRDLLLDEVHALFAQQRAHGNKFANGEFERDYVDIVTWQAPILEGPELLSMVGPCSLDGKNPRVPVASPYFERFRLIDKLANVRFTEGRDVTRRRLTPEHRAVVLSKAFSRKTPLTMADMRRLCELEPEARFVGVRYNNREPEDLSPEKKDKLPAPKGWITVREALEASAPEAWTELECDLELLDQVMTVLTYYKLEHSVRRELSGLALSPDAVDALAGIRFSKNGHLSRETLQAILPHMEKGDSYTDACVAAGFHHSAKEAGTKHRKLPPIPPENLRNPVVTRALSQTRKIVNAIIDEFGPLSELHIELARDVAKSHADRRDIEKMQRENRDRNERAIEEMCKEFGKCVARLRRDTGSVPLRSVAGS